MQKSRFWLRFTVPQDTEGGGTATDSPEPAGEPTPPGDAPSAPADDKQDSFDAAYVAKLRAENAKYRKAAKDNAEAATRLAEIEESQKTEAQKQADQLTRLQQENQQLKLDAMRAQVAAAKNIPDATLLVGSTVEELEAHADKLLAFRGQTPPPDFGAGDRGQVPNQLETLNQQIAQAEKDGNTQLSVSLKRQRFTLQQASTQ